MEEQDRPPPPPPPPPPQTLTLTKPDEFLRSLSRIAVSQVCETRGFHSVHRSALDTLSDLAIRYAFHASKQGVRYAELSGRREPNVVDLIRGIEELGFEGGGVFVGEIGRFVETEAEVPFVRPVTRVPVRKECRLGVSFGISGDERWGDHVPLWLPVYPDGSTYMDSKENGERIEEKEMKCELLSNVVQGQAGASDRVNEMGGGLKVRRVDEAINPFLVPPFRYGEKEVSVVVFPSKLSEEGYVMNEGLSGDSKAAKGDVVGLVEGKGKVGGLEKRPRLQFKLSSCSSRKGFGTPARNDAQKSTLNFDDNDDEKVSKIIVKESAEIPSELAPL